MSNYRLINEYEAPTPEDLQRLKLELGRNGTQMADIAGLADGATWRKYTGGAKPRNLSAASLFYLAAQLTLTPEQLDSVIHKMRDIGAKIR
ncbi:TPA: XRE family transcriptional regulator [Enterobacter hormaechei subsp. steigerwaltii]|nr:XRE family transcriptional regulator [Enterobacter hormaechei subsp. steigerwaltii]